MRSREGQSLRVAVVARSVYPLHRFGGLERHVYDLVRCLLSRDLHVTLITPPPPPDDRLTPAGMRFSGHPKFTMRSVAVRDVSIANRRGRRFSDRSTAYPLFDCVPGAWLRISSGQETSTISRLGASVLGYSMKTLVRTYAHLSFSPTCAENSARPIRPRCSAERLVTGPCAWQFAVQQGRPTGPIATDRSLVAPVTHTLASARMSFASFPRH